MTKTPSDPGVRLLAPGFRCAPTPVRTSPCDAAAMLHHPDGSVTAPEYAELDKRLREGDGLGFPGDPRLWLGEGVVEDSTGRIVARRLEVWRDNEDGSTTIIGSWHPSEQHRVLYDLAQMRVDAPGHVDAIDRIDAHNEAHEAKISEQFRDAMGEALDHALRLKHDRENPRNTFYMNGDPNRGGRA